MIKIKLELFLRIVIETKIMVVVTTMAIIEGMKEMAVLSVIILDIENTITPRQKI